MISIRLLIRILPYLIIICIFYYLYKKKKYLFKSTFETLKVNSFLRNKLVKTAFDIVLRMIGRRF